MGRPHTPTKNWRTIPSTLPLERGIPKQQPFHAMNKGILAMMQNVLCLSKFQVDEIDINCFL